MKIIQHPSSDFYRQETIKNLLVLHYTAGGTLAGAEATLSIKDYVNVHYAIDLDGTIYQYFDEKHWCYHTGSGLADAKRSIGIEIVNWGHLSRKGNELFTWTGKKITWENVIKCAKFRGYEYWHKLTDAQIAVLPGFVADIKSRWLGMQVVTHAQLNSHKLDYPPDYPLIKDLVTIPPKK